MLLAKVPSRAVYRGPGVVTAVRCLGCVALGAQSGQEEDFANALEELQLHGCVARGPNRKLAWGGHIPASWRPGGVLRAPVRRQAGTH